MMNNNIIEPNNSPWKSPVVLVKKRTQTISGSASISGS